MPVSPLAAAHLFKWSCAVVHCDFSDVQVADGSGVLGQHVRIAVAVDEFPT